MLKFTWQLCEVSYIFSLEHLIFTFSHAGSLLSRPILCQQRDYKTSPTGCDVILRNKQTRGCDVWDE